MEPGKDRLTLEAVTRTFRHIMSASRSKVDNSSSSEHWIPKNSIVPREDTSPTNSGSPTSPYDKLDRDEAKDTVDKWMRTTFPARLNPK